MPRMDVEVLEIKDLNRGSMVGDVLKSISDLGGTVTAEGLNTRPDFV